MKCPQCGQWNRASLPNCIRCGAPLNPESAETPAWQEQFRKEDKEPKKYIHVDEDGVRCQSCLHRPLRETQRIARPDDGLGLPRVRQQ